MCPCYEYNMCDAYANNTCIHIQKKLIFSTGHMRANRVNMALGTCSIKYPSAVSLAQ